MGKLTRKGQVTIPKAIREHLGVDTGDAVTFEIVDGSVVVRPVDAATAWEAGKDLFGRHASGDEHRSRDRKRLLKDKLRAGHHRR